MTGDKEPTGKVIVEGAHVEVESIQAGAVAIGHGSRAEQISHYYGKIIVRLDTIEDLPPAPGEPPFKGLTHYTEKDRAIFFGRERMTHRLVDSLDDTRFLALVGASGSGKSSLLRAGVVPILRQRNWLIYIFTPTARPLRQLATILTRDDPSLTAAAELSEVLTAEPEMLGAVTDKLAAQQNASHLLLLVDQFEELFTLCKDETERQAFLNSLLATAEARGAATILTGVRADFYDLCLKYEGLRAVMEADQVALGPMTEAELLQVIAEPAQRGGWQFVEGLVEQILEDVGREPGRLPLLSHALLETWERRRGTVMTLAGYRQAGGVEGAIAHTAEETLRNLPEDHIQVVQRVFLALTELGEGSEDTRRIVGAQELAQLGDEEEVGKIIERLVRARLVTVDGESVEVAHEALIRRWPRLREWLADNREQLRFGRQLARDAEEWEALECDPGALYRGARLSQALEWRKGASERVGPRSLTFLSASQELAERQAREAEARRQRELEQERALAEEQRKLAAEAEARQKAETDARLQAEARAKEALEAEKVQRRTSNRLRRSVYGLVVILVVAVTAAFLAFRASRQATARRMSIEAPQVATDGNLRVASLLAIETGKRDPSFRAKTWNDVLVSSDAPFLEVGSLMGNHGEITGLAWDKDGQRLASASCRETLLYGCSESEIVIWDIGGNFETIVLGGRINSIDWHPSEALIVAGSSDGNVSIWDVSSGTQLEEFQLPEDSIRSVDWHPDGDLIAVSTCKRGPLHCEYRVVVWDVESDQRYLDLDTEDLADHWVGDFSDTSVEWHPGGESRLLFQVRYYLGGSYKIIDFETGEQLLSGSGEDSVWDPSGMYLASATSLGDIIIVDAITGERHFELENSRAIDDRYSVTSLSWHPDGKILALAGCQFYNGETGRCFEGGEVAFWNIEDGEKLAVFSDYQHRLNAIAWSPNGQYLASSSTDRLVRIWEKSNGAEMFTLHEYSVIDYFWDPTGTFLTLSSWGSCDFDFCPNREFVVWDVMEGAERSLLEGTEAYWDPGGQYLTVPQEDNTTQNWNPKLEQGWDFGEGKNGRPMWDPSGEYVAINYGSEVNIYDVESKELQGTIDGFNLVWDPIGKRVAFRNPSVNGSGIGVYVVESGETSIFMKGSSVIPESMFWDYQGERLFVQEEGNVTMLNTITKEEEVIIKSTPDHFVNSVKYIPNTNTLALTYTNNELNTMNEIRKEQFEGEHYHIWDIDKGEEITIFEDQSDNQYSHEIWSPNGEYLATAYCKKVSEIWEDVFQCAQGEIIIWDAVNRKKLTTFQGHTDVINSLAWHSDSKRIASASCIDREENLLACEQSEIVIWDAEEGAELTKFESIPTTIKSMAWRPGGDRIAFSLEDGTLKVANTLIGCDRILTNFTPQEWREAFGPLSPYRAACPELPSFSPGTVPFFEDPFLTYGSWAELIVMTLFVVAALIASIRLISRWRRRRATTM